MIYVLFIVLIGFLGISYLYTKDIFSPPCMICESYILATFCALLNVKRWVIDLRERTVLILLYGVLVFIIAYFLFSLISKIREKKIKSKRINLVTKGEDEKKVEYINYFNISCGIVLVAQLVFVIAYLNFFAQSMGGNVSTSNFSEMMMEYRNETSFEDSLQIPTILKQLHKFFKGYVYLMTYIEIHNLLVSKYKKENKKLSSIFLMSVALFFIQAILSSGRAELVIYFIFTMITYYTLYVRLFGLNSFTISKILKIVCIVMLALYCFSALKTVFGRVSNDGMIEYISRYFGGSIKLFDLYLENPPLKSDIWGKETFYNVHQVLAKLGFGNKYLVHLEFRSSNGIVLGNVYTAFRRMYQDFGLGGLTLLQIIFAGIMHYYYKRVYINKNLDRISIFDVFYGIIAHTLLLNSFSEYFYSSIISVNYLLIIMYMYIISEFITKVKIKVR